jgi:hypothetical protein
MKSRILLLVLGLGFGPSALLAGTKSKEQQVLKAIDDICGDTWCEGGFEYRFDKLAVDPVKKQAELTFEMKFLEPLSFSVTTEKPVYAQILSQSFDVSCRIDGVTDAAEMLTGGHSLRWDVYASLNDCIASLEGRFYRILRP